MATLATTLGIAISGGLVTGWLASKIGRTPQLLFEDKEHWMHVEYDWEVAKEEKKTPEDKPDADKNEKEEKRKNKVEPSENPSKPEDNAVPIQVNN